MSDQPWGLISTTPTPGARHDGLACELIARLMGYTPMPWQRRMFRIGTELLPDGIGWRWPIMYVSVPRQSGKTLGTQTLQTQRAILGRNTGAPGWHAFATAQTGKDAGERWNDLVERVTTSTLGSLGDWGVRLQAGTQALTVPTIGSRLRPFAPTPKSIHGSTPPLVMIDEGFAFDAVRGNQLTGAILPAQQTLPDRQLWIFSTRGNASSTWLHQWDDLAIEAAQDPASKLGALIYSLPPEADPYDPEAIARFHPAVGHTVTIETLMEHAAVLPREEWERAYCNRWTTASSSIIDLGAWDRLATHIAPPPDKAVIGLAYEVAPDRSSAALVAAWHDAQAHVDNLKVVKAAPGLEWIPAAIDSVIASRPKGTVIVGADDAGATRIVTDRMIHDGRTIETLRAGDFATATGTLLWSIEQSAIRHDGSKALRRAVEIATDRPLGDATAFARRGAIEPISPLIAAAVALRLVALAPKPVDLKPFIYGGF